MCSQRKVDKQTKEKVIYRGLDMCFQLSEAHFFSRLIFISFWTISSPDFFLIHCYKRCQKITISLMLCLTYTHAKSETRYIMPKVPYFTTTSLNIGALFLQLTLVQSFLILFLLPNCAFPAHQIRNLESQPHLVDKTFYSAWQQLHETKKIQHYLIKTISPA